MFVIGTAGHVDHGKSTLVHALTGIDPDRLEEEKTRGMTIDLGFAWLRLPGGREVSIVDVPGHERFIKNMLAGVGGIDVALLVVAADEGVMPQTREHLAILNLLDIRSGVVAISKCDLVEADWLELVMSDVEDLLSGTTLDGSPLVACSAVTGAGIPALLACLEERLDRTQERRDVGRPRLWIDRSFTVSGFGSVITGTLIDGALQVGQEIELLPAEQRVRVRGLQTHGQKVERSLPGSRTAVNLAGISAEDLHRGTLLTLPGWLHPTTAADVRLSSVPDRPRPIKHNAFVTFYTGSAEVPAKVRLLDRAELAPGDWCWAQVRLAQPLPLVKGDAFVLRTPNDTVAGGSVVDGHPRRHRRHHAPTLASLEVMDRGTPADALLGVLAKLEPVEAGRLAHESGQAADVVDGLMRELVESGRAVRLGATGILYTLAGYRHVLNGGLGLLRGYFSEHPLRMGMPREELKSRLNLPPKLFNELIDRWLEEGEVSESRASIGLPGRTVALSPAQREITERFLSDLRASPYAPSSEHLPPPDLLGYLTEREEVVLLSEGIVLGMEAFREATGRVCEYLREHERITLAQVRDQLSTSRKYAQAILEHLDETRVTRRIGDERVLRATEPVRR